MGKTRVLLHTGVGQILKINKISRGGSDLRHNIQGFPFVIEAPAIVQEVRRILEQFLLSA